MKPVSPIIPGIDLPETVYAKDQPEYIPLPVYKYEDGTVLSRWKLSWRERLTMLVNGDLYLWVITLNRPLQPVAMAVEKPEAYKVERPSFSVRLDNFKGTFINKLRQSA